MTAALAIFAGKFEEQAKYLEAESVHLVVTSPPYDDLRTYGVNDDGFDFEAVARAIHRVLVPGGIICWNVGDSTKDGSETLTSCEQKIFFRRALGMRIHDTMIYEKANFGQPSRNRYHQLFEYVFILSKGAPRVFNPLKDKPNAWAGTQTFGRNTIRESDGSIGERFRNTITEFGMRGNVWRGKTRGQEDCCRGAEHPAMMPRWLARDLILSWSNPGDTVMDPMAGSGTTGVEALKLGRKTILCEREPEHVKLIRKNLVVTPGFQF